MFTNVDIPAADRGVASRRRRYLLLAALLVVTVGGLFAANQTGFLGDDTPTGAAGQEGFQAQLSAKVVNILERMPAADHGHANHGGAGRSTMVCGVRIFGLDPADADTVGEVKQVYAYHLCGLAEPGRDWVMSVKLTGPAVITLSADPPTVAVAEGGEGFRDRVRQLFPQRLHAEAFNENLTPEGMRELIARYDNAAQS